MTPHIGVTQDTIEIIDPNDAMIPTDAIQVFSEIAHDRLIASRDTSHEAQTDSGATHAIVWTAHAHQVIFALEIEAHMGVMNVHVLTHPCTTCHVSDLAAHSTHLQITNILHHRNKSRQT